MKKHIQNVATHQHPYDIGMDIRRRNLGVMKELFEDRWKGKADPRVELFLGEIHGVVFDFINRCWISLYELNGDTVRKTEAVAKLPQVEKLTRFPRIGASGIHNCLATLPTCPSSAG